MSRDAIKIKVPVRSRSGLLARVARWSIGHRLIVIFAWLVLLVGVLVISNAVGPRYATNFSLKNSDSQRAEDLLQRSFPAQSGDSSQIVFHVRRGAITDPGVRATIAPMFGRVAKLPHVTGVVTPFGRAGAAALSPNRKIAFATVTFDRSASDLPVSAAKRVISTAEDARSPRLQVELGGQAIQLTRQPSLGLTTAVGILAAIAILLITFGSLLAMGLPIVTALLGLGTGVGLIGIGTHVLDMPDWTTQLAIMIGLGVGIDYSLFIVTRFRENLHRGTELDEAVVAAMDTAGRAILFAGCTVIIALLGMFVLGVTFLYGVAVAASIGVLMTMLAALTVLPALLSRFGKRIGRRRFGRGKIDADASEDDKEKAHFESGLWARWARVIRRHPWLAGTVGLVIMVLLTLPALSMRFGTSDAGNDPSNLTTRKAYDLLAQGFGKGSNGPLLVVVKLSRSAGKAAVDSVAAVLRSTHDVAAVSPPRFNTKGDVAVLNAYPRSAPQDQATTDLVNQLRKDRLPAVEKSTGATVLVGGVTGLQIDFTNLLASKLPLFIAIVVLLSALLLLVVFRSLVIPVQAAVMNLLSIGAALGVVVLVFQHGWLGGLFNVEPGPIDAFVPVMVFAIVFGLSMDYEVFLVSRIHEELVHGSEPSEAVARGLSTTGRVITAAATIMICVFLSFAVGGERILKLFGLSLASAVFLDAFVVRVLLVPAVLDLLGRATWMLPSWLERVLPHISVEPPEDVTPG